MNKIKLYTMIFAIITGISVIFAIFHQGNASNTKEATAESKSGETMSSQVQPLGVQAGGIQTQNTSMIANQEVFKPMALSSVDNKNKKTEKSFIINNELKDIYDKSIISEKTYNFIQGIDLNNDTIIMDVTIDTAKFNESIDNLTAAVSLAYNFKKLTSKSINHVKMSIYDKQGQFVHQANIEVQKVTDILSLIGNGLDGSKKYQLYDVLNLLPLIKTHFPKEYGSLITLKEQKNDVEILRNKGTTDEIFKNSKLYNLDKISKNNFRNMITNNKITLRSIDLVNNIISGNTVINTKGDPNTEFNKISSTITVLYSFIDFEKNITEIKVNLYDETGKSINTITIQASELTEIIKALKVNKDDKQVLNKYNDLLNMKDIYSHFKK